ncbi:hypothetical protein L5515_014355 [Caenorhabditis briggsae]|uniref:RAI1-like domain-containing protein n=1 Tax=Caenorhabditis briggsae TaxID=6238 RepID=A0AAE9ED49_CAEBR|nr:hypothetical protein L5515_014355 [Caenorhabditis briggsae]
MEQIDVDPWIDTGVSAHETLCIHAYLPSFAFVTSRGTTLTKTRDKHLEERRMIPEEFFKVFDEKFSGPLYPTPPIEIENICSAFLKGSSSQHMSTILEGIQNLGADFKKIDYLVASETLHKISGAVFNQTRSWRLRAYPEIVDGHRVIILCDDDFEEIEITPLKDSQFLKHRKESINFAQQMCSRYENRKTNHFLHASKMVSSSLTYRGCSVKMVVVGEVDMVTDKQEFVAFNAAVLTGRPNRVQLGDDEDSITESFEYLWSRCFWMGMTSCLIGMRSTQTEPVKAIHHFDIKDFAQKYRGRIGGYHDTATTCVAQVMNRLREAVYSRPNVNWIVEYEGRSEEFEPGYIKITEAAQSVSFWLLHENYLLTKDELTKRLVEKEKRMMEETARISKLARKSQPKTKINSKDETAEATKPRKEAGREITSGGSKKSRNISKESMEALPNNKLFDRKHPREYTKRSEKLPEKERSGPKIRKTESSILIEKSREQCQKSFKRIK